MASVKVSTPFEAYQGDQPYIFVSNSHSHQDGATVVCRNEVQWFSGLRFRINTICAHVRKLPPLFYKSESFLWLNRFNRLGAFFEKRLRRGVARSREDTEGTVMAWKGLRCWLLECRIICVSAPRRELRSIQ